MFAWFKQCLLFAQTCEMNPRYDRLCFLIGISVQEYFDGTWPISSNNNFRSTRPSSGVVIFGWNNIPWTRSKDGGSDYSTVSYKEKNIIFLNNKCDTGQWLRSKNVSIVIGKKRVSNKMCLHHFQNSVQTLKLQRNHLYVLEQLSIFIISNGRSIQSDVPSIFSACSIDYSAYVLWSRSSFLSWFFERFVRPFTWETFVKIIFIFPGWRNTMLRSPHIHIMIFRAWND